MKLSLKNYSFFNKFMNNVIELTSENFEAEVLKSTIPILVDFWAPWCGPCRLMAPILDELAGEMSGKIKIAKLNVDEPRHQALAMAYNVQGIPNMQVFKNGAVVKELVGARPKEALKSDLESVIG